MKLSSLRTRLVFVYLIITIVMFSIFAWTAYRSTALDLEAALGQRLTTIAKVAAYLSIAAWGRECDFASRQGSDAAGRMVVTLYEQFPSMKFKATFHRLWVSIGSNCDRVARRYTRLLGVPFQVLGGS